MRLTATGTAKDNGMSTRSTRVHPDTAAARHAIDSDGNHGAVVPPLYLSSNFSFQGFGEKREYDYTRSGNPNRDQLAGALAAIEGGAGAVITGSGMSAVHLATQLLEPGDILFAPNDCYGGCHRLFTAEAGKGRFDLRWLPLWETVLSVEQIIETRPRMVWIETPSNPLLRISDIQALAEAAHHVNALVVVDNTFLSPAGQRPFELGADIVLHSTTKYINGHSDVVGGALLARDPSVLEELSWWANCLGVTGSPFDSFQTLRGLRTLPVRFRQHEDNAAVIADYLGGEQRVSKVFYPGLKSHPGHGLARRQQLGFGAMISFELDAGEGDLRRFLDHLELFTLAESLGGVESLVAHPASMTHAAMSEADQLAAGISPSLLRLSIGIEHADDLIRDLKQGFKALRRRPGQQKVRSVA
jgi:cystathionine gamma-synthase